MKVLEALIAECEPFSPDSRLLKKSLIDVGLSEDSDYTVAINNKIREAAVLVLSKLVVLTSESESGFGQSFDGEMLKNRVNVLCAQIGIDASKYLNLPTISSEKYW